MSDRPTQATSTRIKVLGGVSWLWVGVPFMYDVYELVVKIPGLFAH